MSVHSHKFSTFDLLRKIHENIFFFFRLLGSIQKLSSSTSLANGDFNEVGPNIGILATATSKSTFNGIVLATSAHPSSDLDASNVREVTKFSTYILFSNKKTNHCIPQKKHLTLRVISETLVIFSIFLYVQCLEKVPSILQN
jgi:hypothetical protein